MIDVKVPELGESITEGTISNWLINEGDRVDEGDILVEIETDKVNLEVNAEHSGILQEIIKQPGDTVEVGEVIAKLGEGGEDSSSPTSDTAQDRLQPEGDQQQAHESDVQRETGGRQQDVTDQQEEQNDTSPVASPAARKLAREQGLDLSRVQTQDPAGRISIEDVKAHTQTSTSAAQTEASAPRTESRSEQKTAQPPADTSTAKPQAAQDDPEKPVERIRMSRRRQTIAKRLVEAQHNAAMLTTFNEVDMTAILDVRRRRKESFREQHDINLGFMSFFTKAVVGALKAFPLLNAEIQGQEMLVKKYYDIGIAVSAEGGLVVPVVRNTDRLSFAEIEQEIASLAEKARSNSLGLKELQGGTFTITNGGIFGSLLSTPILNTPQVGILGMHKIQKRPVTVDDDRMENRPMMYIALSYDHRIVDGKEAVQFLVKIKEMLEDPEVLLLEG